MPPTVAPRPKCGGSNGRHWPCSASVASSCASGVPQRAHLLMLLGRELHTHRAQLLDAHAVLAGDGAAQAHAGLEDVGAEALAAMQLIGIVGVEEDQRVQVAVAGMEHVDAAQAVG